MNKIQILTLAFILFAFCANGQTIFVKHDADGANDGSSWTDAFTNLETAIDEAEAGDAIWVAAGTYTPTTERGGDGDQFRAFQMNNGVAIYGGFQGNEDPETFNLDERDFIDNETFLSGDLGNGTNVYHVFRHVNAGLDHTAVLDGFTISGGKADGDANVDKRGGGMLNVVTESSTDGSSPTIRNCVFRDNEAADDGGAMYNSQHSKPDVSYTTFENNAAGNSGGAVYNDRNITVFNHCTFTNNSSAGDGDSKGGGAIFFTSEDASESMVVSNSAFHGNKSSDSRGGAIHSSLNPGILTVTYSVFTNNEAEYGGALYQSSTTDSHRDNSAVSFSNSRFDENSADEDGGAIYSNRHNLNVVSCVIRGNEAKNGGGLFSQHAGESSIINNLLSGNKATEDGGGFYFHTDTDTKIINNTITGNYAGVNGGGIVSVDATSLKIFNTILWNNACSVEGNELYVSGDFITQFDYSLYGNDTDDLSLNNSATIESDNSLHVDPGFVNAIDDPTEENTPNTLGNYFICGCTSPSIDAGNNDLVPPEIEEDLRGNDRVLDGNMDGIATIDLGAYEFDPTGANALEPEGEGTEENPYLIAILQNLYWITVDDSRWDKHYEQVANIDACNTEFWFGGDGWPPIGNGTTPFRGNYDGKGYSIRNLHINRPGNNDIGLFGLVAGTSTTNAVIKNLSLVNVKITGYRQVGALFGMGDQWVEITNCHSNGSVRGNRNTGGLAGWGRRTNFTHCSSAATVLLNDEGGALYHGGLIGHINTNSVVEQSFATGNVSGRSRVGGLIGAMGWNSQLKNSYARGDVDTTIDGPMMGGLVGEVFNAGIENSYSTGDVDNTGVNSEYGGLVGNKTTDNNYFDRNNFWDIETSGVSESQMGTGTNTFQMKDENTFTGWDFNDVWAIDPIINDGYPYLESSLFVWTGDTDTDWNNANNWNQATTPDTGANILIPETSDHDPVLDSDRTVGNLSIADEAMLTIHPGINLTVNGELINEAGPSGLLIKSTEAGTGSLIHNSEDVEATVERYIAAADWSDGTDGWHFLSAPVAGQLIEGIWTPDGSSDNDYDFYAWSEEDPGQWLNQKVEGNDIIEFTPGVGYLVAYEQNTTGVFSNTLNVGTVSVTLKNTGTKDEWEYQPGWNLLGNPYASGIDWNKADRQHFVDDFAYIYNTNRIGGAGYEEIDGGAVFSAYIAAHQGFFVQVKPGANDEDFVFDNAMRVHEGSFLKSPQYSDKMVLRLAKNDYYDQTVIRIIMWSSFERDRRDALKMFSFNPEVPQVYSYTADQTRVAINSIPHIDKEQQINLGMRIPTNGEYILSLPEISGVFSASTLLLEDAETDTIHNLQSYPEYRFQAVEGDLEGRFVLHFSPLDDDGDEDPTSITEADDGNSTRMWYHSNRLYVETDESGTLLTIYNLNGYVLQTYRPEPGLQSYHINLPPGAYIARLNGNNTHETLKIITTNTP